MRRLLRAEPVAVTGLAAALLAVAVGFGVDLDPEQVAALVALIGAAFGFVRSLVYSPDTATTMVVDAAVGTAVAIGQETAGPVGHLTEAGKLVADRVAKIVTGGLYDPRSASRAAAASGEGKEGGGIPLAALFVILAIALALGLGFASCDALFEDDDEPGDLGAPPHTPAGAPGPRDHDYRDGWDGGSDGNSGGEYEGGRGGADYDGDGDGNRCRNFCFYGVPYPGQPTTL